MQPTNNDHCHQMTFIADCRASASAFEVGQLRCRVSMQSGENFSLSSSKGVRNHSHGVFVNINTGSASALVHADQ